MVRLVGTISINAQDRQYHVINIITIYYSHLCCVMSLGHYARSRSRDRIEAGSRLPPQVGRPISRGAPGRNTFINQLLEYGQRRSDVCLSRKARSSTVRVAGATPSSKLATVRPQASLPATQGIASTCLPSSGMWDFMFGWDQSAPKAPRPGSAPPSVGRRERNPRSRGKQ